MGTKDISTMQPLIQARNAALENPSLYPQVLPPILGLVTDDHNPSIELRRWVADFLAEILASPVLQTEEKQTMALLILPVLKMFLETAGEDVVLMKSVIQAAASLYPLVFRYM
jgi:symplekin